MSSKGRKQGRITKADLIWSAAAVILIFFMHGAGYL